MFWDVRDSSRNKLPESRKTSFIERETVQMPANSQVDTNFDSTFSVGIEYLKHLSLTRKSALTTFSIPYKVRSVNLL